MLPGNNLRDNEFMSPSLSPERLHGQYFVDAMRAHFKPITDPSVWKLISGDHADMFRNALEMRRRNHA